MTDTSPTPATPGRIRTSGDSEVATYLEIAEAREPGQALTPAPNAPEAVVILDYGSQFSMLITRRIREASVYCEMVPWDTPPEKLSHLKVKAFVLSGGPSSVYDDGAPSLPPYVLGSGVPVLGICYGMQLLAHALGGKVDPAPAREYGHAVLRVAEGEHPLFKGLTSDLAVWMSHGDHVVQLPKGFRVIGQSENAPMAAMADDAGRVAIQFHPEVVHTPQGQELISNFLFEVAACRPTGDCSSNS